MKHVRLLAVVAVAVMPACLVYDSDLLSQAQGGSSSTGGRGGDGDGDGDGDTGGSGAMTGGNGGNTGGRSGDGGTGGSGDGDGDGDGPSGGMGMGGDPGSGGATGGDSSGGASSGGGPSGGAPSWTGACPDYDGPETLDLVDDMRSGSNAILTRSGRKGTYLAFHGAAMSMVPDPAASGLWPTDPLPMSLVPPVENADYALHLITTQLSENPAEEWQQFGFLLNEGNPVDLSAYTGVMFCARRDATIPQFFDLRVVEGDQDPMNDVDHETPGDTGITPTWSYVKFAFDSTWPPEALTGAKSISFLLGNGVEYDVWIDNIYLYTE